MWRHRRLLPAELIFNVNYLGGNMPTLALNFSRPGGQVIALVVLTLFIFVFLTPTGLLALYLVTSGTIRAVAAFTDAEDARGDFVLSAVHRVWTTLWATLRQTRARIARERLEGDERPDLLQTGEWASVDADYVVLASRRKPGSVIHDPDAVVARALPEVWAAVGLAGTPANTRFAGDVRSMPER